MIRHIIGDLRLQPDQRSEWAAHTNSYRDPVTGRYPAARYLHLFGTVIRALNAVGAAPRYRPAFPREWDDAGYTIQWIEELSWSSPWESSICTLHVAAPRGAAGSPDASRWLVEVLAWLDGAQDPDTGFWGTNRGASLFDGMGAAFHFLPLYEASGRPMPRGRRIVDSTLSLQTDGLWGGVFADMDAVSMLVHCHLADDHRKFDTQTGGFGSLGDTLGACELLAEAARMLGPGHLCSGLDCFRAWDWRLWDTGCRSR